MNTPTSSSGFWSALPRPFFCMAPMADVTDASFRRIFAQYGKPDVTWTEFVSADGLFLRPHTEASTAPSTEFKRIALEHGVGADQPLLHDLVYSDIEKPIVAQFFSRDADRMRRAAELSRALGFDGIDINMGCPADVICNQGAGAAMIKEPEHAVALIQATIAGAGDLPVSVKTRVGYHKKEIETWIPALLTSGITALSVHLRTRSEMSKVDAHWEYMQEIVALRNTHAPHVLIIGNGDITSREEGIRRVTESGCDGIMVGRGIFGNPWLFHPTITKESLEPNFIADVLAEHTFLFEHFLGGVKSFALMKKHFKSYLETIPESKQLRIELIEKGNTYTEVRSILATHGFNLSETEVYEERLRTNPAHGDGMGK